MASSLVLMRTPDPTVRPRPRVDDLPLAPTGFSDQQTARPQAKAKPAKPGTIDDLGKTDALKLKTRDGPDLRGRGGVRQGVGRRLRRQGRSPPGLGVAISDSEPLTNCHVVGDLAEVKIARAKARAARQGRPTQC